MVSASVQKPMHKSEFHSKAKEDESQLSVPLLPNFLNDKDEDNLANKRRVQSVNVVNVDDHALSEIETKIRHRTESMITRMMASTHHVNKLMINNFNA